MISSQCRRHQCKTSLAKNRQPKHLLNHNRPTPPALWHPVINLLTNPCPDKHVQHRLNCIEPLGGEGFLDFGSAGGEELGADERGDEAFVGLDDVEPPCGAFGKGGHHGLSLKEGDVISESCGCEHLTLPMNCQSSLEKLPKKRVGRGLTYFWSMCHGQ